MKRLLILLALIAAGCTSGTTVSDGLREQHDPIHHVTCWAWTTSNYAISCLPDSEVTIP